MSDTPRTDGLIARNSKLLVTGRLVNLSRQLERENQQLKAELGVCAEALRVADNAFHGSPSGQSIIDKALSQPITKSLLK